MIGLGTLMRILNADLNLSNNAKKVIFFHDDFYQLVGRMVEQRVLVDSSISDRTIYALNNTQINKSVEIGLRDAIFYCWLVLSVFNG